jgi:hypothetical protein
MFVCSTYLIVYASSSLLLNSLFSLCTCTTVEASSSDNICDSMSDDERLVMLLHTTYTVFSVPLTLSLSKDSMPTFCNFCGAYLVETSPDATLSVAREALNAHGMWQRQSLLLLCCCCSCCCCCATSVMARTAAKQYHNWLYAPAAYTRPLLAAHSS